MKTSLNSPTKYEQTRIDAMRKQGCVACAVLGVPNLNELELNHMLDGGHRMGHWFTIFLCRGHHQGAWSEGQLEWIEAKKRVAISDSRRLFATVYGTERSLWEKVQKKLKLPALWPVSKIVPRRPHVEVDSHRVAAPESPVVLVPGQAQLAAGRAEHLTGSAAEDHRGPGRAS